MAILPACINEITDLEELCVQSRGIGQLKEAQKKERITKDPSSFFPYQLCPWEWDNSPVIRLSEIPVPKARGSLL